MNAYLHFVSHIVLFTNEIKWIHPNSGIVQTNMLMCLDTDMQKWFPQVDQQMALVYEFALF